MSTVAPNTLLVLLLATTSISLAQGLQPWPENRWYWSLDGEPVLLLGGSDDDNLFQWPEAELLTQLDRIAAAGGNVVRNTMSDRPDQGFEVYPFAQHDDGKYDLEQWNPEYWARFDRFLNETAKRKIFVQIEVWDRFDYTDSSQEKWQKHPYNPANNVNYTFEQSGFAPRYPDHPGANHQAFFFTTPEQRNNQIVLKYQQRFVERMLQSTLTHDHVLYCIDNETSAQAAWGRYWANFIKDHARQAGKQVNVTEMWDDWNLEGEQHKQTFDHPELYDFVDVSQNNHNSGRVHWDRFRYVRDYLANHPRPINTTKTYGASGNKFGHTDQDGVERFWRHLLAGAASMRFHRPDSGLGINDRAVAAIQAARKLESLVALWSIDPMDDRLRFVSDDRISEQVINDNTAYASGNDRVIAIFVPANESERGSQFAVDLGDASPSRTFRWINIDSGQWGDEGSVESGGWSKWQAPSNGNWALVLTNDASG